MAPAQDKRRRRKRARTADDSDSDSENVKMATQSSSDSSSEAPESDNDQSDHSDGEQDEPSSYANARLKVHNAPSSDQDFNQYFLQMVTQQFGDELEQLRKAADFNESSLELLIAGLKQGANIFDPEQKKLLLKAEM